MNETTVFNEINRRLQEGLMLHSQLADYFDFCDLRGLKRWNENLYFQDMCEYRGLHRYVINNCNKLLSDDNFGYGATKVIPSNWYNYSRFEVDISTRKQAVKEAFEKWYSWEKETKELYEKKFKELAERGAIQDANKVNELIKTISCELKDLTRKMIEYKAVDYSMEYIMIEQTEMHNHYEAKLEEGYKITIS